MRIQEVGDRLLQSADATEDAAPQGFGREFREESLDHVQPRRRRRREVTVEPGMLGKPLLHLGGLMRAIVVQNQMQLHVATRLAVNRAQKPQELLLPMPGQALPDHAAVHNVQGNSPIENVLAMFKAIKDSAQ